MKIQDLPKIEASCFEEEIAWLNAREKYRLTLAKRVSSKKKGCFAVKYKDGRYAMVTPNNGDEWWRLTTYDSDGFAFGHHCDTWEKIASEAMCGAIEFVDDIPEPPWDSGTKEELLDKVRRNDCGPHTTKTLSLLYNMSTLEIQDVYIEGLVERGEYTPA